MGRFVVITNLTCGTEVADRAVLATAPWTRAIGLLARRSLEPGEGMIFPRCRSIHTCGMRVLIDVVFLQDGRVVKALPQLGSWRVVSAPTADTVVELPSGTIAASGITEGATLHWSEKMVPGTIS